MAQPQVREEIQEYIHEDIKVGGCEIFQAATRVVVAPAPGSFEPDASLAETSAPVTIARGQVLGHITGTSGRIAVTSPFAGVLDKMIAWSDERLQKHQRVLTMSEVY
jgi:hypothetical protein